MTERINRALVVDDSRLARIALSKLLQKRDVAVDVVGTGGEAIDYLRDNRPDVVFMDYMMPDMDGFEATRHIRDRYADDFPVVMYTSQDTAEDREKARQLGIAGFLSKPSGERNLDEVLSQLAAVLDERPRSPEPAAAPAPEPVTGAGASAEAEPGVDGVGAAAPVSGPAPEPAPAVAGLSADEARALAREVADEAVSEALARFSGERLDPLRRELEGVGDSAREAAREAAASAVAEQPAGGGQPDRAAVEEIASEVADSRARRIAEEVAHETASRVADEVGPEAARRIMADLRRDVRNYVSELFAADAFHDQILEIVRTSALPELGQKVSSEVLPAVREQVTADAVRASEQAAIDAARSHSEEAAREAAEKAIDSRMAQLGTTAADTARAEVGGVRRLVVGLAVVLGLAVAGNIGLTLYLTGLI